MNSPCFMVFYRSHGILLLFIKPRNKQLSAGQYAEDFVHVAWSPYDRDLPDKYLHIRGCIAIYIICLLCYPVVHCYQLCSFNWSVRCRKYSRSAALRLSDKSHIENSFWIFNGFISYHDLLFSHTVFSKGLILFF